MEGLTLAACWIGIASSACTFEVIEGSGDSATEQREVPAFKAVSNASMLDVELVVGAEQLVEITCDDNLLDYLRTEVDDGELKLFQPTVIDEPNHFVELDPRTDCRAVIATPRVVAVRNVGSGELESSGALDELAEVESTGSGDTRLVDIDVTRLEVRVTGSGDVELAGCVSTLDLESTGSGSIFAAGVAARDATVKVTGSGDVEIAASGDVDVKITGSGDVYIAGRPGSLQVSTPGSGRVIFQ
jgi:hypothetical protein